MIRFGITLFAGMFILKINAKLTEAMREELSNLFPELQLTAIGKGLTRIEGYLDHKIYHSIFKPNLEIAIKQSRISFQQEELDQLRFEHFCQQAQYLPYELDSMLDEPSYIDDDDLPF